MSQSCASKYPNKIRVIEKIQKAVCVDIKCFLLYLVDITDDIFWKQIVNDFLSCTLKQDQ